MGVDVKIEFFYSGDDINELAYDLARRVPYGVFKEHQHPCVGRLCDWLTEYSKEWEPVEPPEMMRVDLWSSWFGPGYERGEWPHIRSILDYLLHHDDVRHLWYYGDSCDRSEEWLVTSEMIAELDEHYRSGFWTYRWDLHHSIWPTTRRPETPIDAYGHPMKRNGWGNDFAVFYSPATGERREWRDGEWVTKDDVA